MSAPNSGPNTPKAAPETVAFYLDKLEALVLEAKGKGVILTVTEKSEEGNFRMGVYNLVSEARPGWNY